MTDFSSWSIRLSLIYLMIGISIGAGMLTNRAYGLFPIFFRFLPIHQELLLSGWFLNFIFGTAYWMFPRFTPKKSGMEYPRGFVRAAWVAWISLNLGLLLFVAAQFIEWDFPVQLLARFLEALGVFLFLLHLWPRTKPISD